MSAEAYKYERGAEIECKTCGTPFKVFYDEDQRGECGDCRKAAYKAQEFRGRWNNWWKTYCPPKMREDFRPEMVPAGLPEAVMTWTYGPVGLLLTGKTGCGKTRIMWQVIKRLISEIIQNHTRPGGEPAARHRQLPEHIKFITSSTLQIAFTEWACDRPADDDAGRLVTRFKILNAELLFIDDIGKNAFTPRAEMELFHLLDHRMNHYLPTLFTANAEPGELAAKLSSEYGEPMLRRIMDACRWIQYNEATGVRVREPGNSVEQPEETFRPEPVEFSAVAESKKGSPYRPTNMGMGGV